MAVIFVGIITASNRRLQSDTLTGLSHCNFIIVLGLCRCASQVLKTFSPNKIKLKKGSVLQFDIPETKHICQRCLTVNWQSDLSNLMYSACVLFILANPHMKSSYIFERRVLYLRHMVAMNLPDFSLSGFINEHGYISMPLKKKNLFA